MGVSRRTYYLGTVLLIVALCALNAAILTALWALEGATDGWGLQLHFFRVPWILDRPWYQVLVTNGVLLALVFLIGLWTGLIYRRFGLIGTLAFFGLWTVLGVGAVLLATWRQWWPAVGRFLSDLDVHCRQRDAGTGGGRGRRRRLPHHPADRRLSKRVERVRRGPSNPRRARSVVRPRER